MIRTRAKESSTPSRPWLRATSLGMALSFAYVHVLYGAIEPVKSFWQERRKNARETFLARLPEIRLPALPMRENAPARLPESRLQDLSQTGPRLKDVPKCLRAVPLRSASLKDLSLPRTWRPGAPFIIHIQDAHGNVEAQAHIARILESLYQPETPPIIVGIEGARGPFNFQPYRSFPDVQVTREIAGYFMKESLITGPEYAGMTLGLGSAKGESAAEPPLLFWGVEDEDLYLSHVEALKDSVHLQAAAKMSLLRLSQSLTELKDRILPPSLKELDSKISLYEGGRIGLGFFLKTLSRRTPPGPEVRKFLSALALEESLNYPKLEEQRASLIRALSEKLEKNELDRLTSAGLEYRAQRLSHGTFYRLLCDFCKSHGIDLSRWEELDRYVRYVFLSDSIRAEGLFQEIAAMKERALRGEAKTEAQKRLLELAEDLELLEKMTDFTLGPQEWERYRARKGEIERIGRRIEDLGGKRIEEGGPLRTPFENFNAMAVARNGALVENLLAKMRERSEADPGAAPIAVLVAGGFHTDGITRLLRERGIAYAVLAPRLDRETGTGAEYLSAFTRDKTPLEKLFTGERITLNQEPGTVFHWLAQTMPPAVALIQREFAVLAVARLFDREMRGRIRASPADRLRVVGAIRRWAQSARLTSVERCEDISFPDEATAEGPSPVTVVFRERKEAGGDPLRISAEIVPPGASASKPAIAVVRFPDSSEIRIPLQPPAPPFQERIRSFLRGGFQIGRGPQTLKLSRASLGARREGRGWDIAQEIEEVLFDPLIEEAVATGLVLHFFQGSLPAFLLARAILIGLHVLRPQFENQTLFEKIFIPSLTSLLSAASYGFFWLNPDLAVSFASFFSPLPGYAALLERGGTTVMSTVTAAYFGHAALNALTPSLRAVLGRRVSRSDLRPWVRGFLIPFLLVFSILMIDAWMSTGPAIPGADDPRYLFLNGNIWETLFQLIKPVLLLSALYAGIALTGAILRGPSFVERAARETVHLPLFGSIFLGSTFANLANLVRHGWIVRNYIPIADHFFTLGDLGLMFSLIYLYNGVFRTLLLAIYPKHIRTSERVLILVSSLLLPLVMLNLSQTQYLQLLDPESIRDVPLFQRAEFWLSIPMAVLTLAAVLRTLARKAGAEGRRSEGINQKNYGFENVRLNESQLIDAGERMDIAWACDRAFHLTPGRQSQNREFKLAFHLAYGPLASALGLGGDFSATDLIRGCLAWIERGSPRGPPVQFFRLSQPLTDPQSRENLRAYSQIDRRAQEVIGIRIYATEDNPVGLAHELMETLSLLLLKDPRAHTKAAVLLEGAFSDQIVTPRAVQQIQGMTSMELDRLIVDFPRAVIEILRHTQDLADYHLRSYLLNFAEEFHALARQEREKRPWGSAAMRILEIFNVEWARSARPVSRLTAVYRHLRRIETERIGHQEEIHVRFNHFPPIFYEFVLSSANVIEFCKLPQSDQLDLYNFLLSHRPPVALTRFLPALKEAYDYGQAAGLWSLFLLMTDGERPLQREAGFNPISTEQLDHLREVLLWLVQKYDPGFTYLHLLRVQRLARILIDRLDWDPKDRALALTAITLHDIGKIFTPKSILWKNGGLNPIEKRVMSLHDFNGNLIVKELTGFSLLGELVENHQKWYQDYDPKVRDDLSNKEAMIPQIAAIIDAWDAMTQKRPYRGEKPQLKAVRELEDNSGTQFNPRLVDLALDVFLHTHRASRKSLLGAAGMGAALGILFTTALAPALLSFGVIPFGCVGVFLIGSGVHWVQVLWIIRAVRSQARHDGLVPEWTGPEVRMDPSLKWSPAAAREGALVLNPELMARLPHWLQRVIYKHELRHLRHERLSRVPLLGEFAISLWDVADTLDELRFRLAWNESERSSREYEKWMATPLEKLFPGLERGELERRFNARALNPDGLRWLAQRWSWAAAARAMLGESPAIPQDAGLARVLPFLDAGELAALGSAPFPNTVEDLESYGLKLAETTGALECSGMQTPSLGKILEHLRLGLAALERTDLKISEEALTSARKRGWEAAEAGFKGKALPIGSIPQEGEIASCGIEVLDLLDAAPENIAGFAARLAKASEENRNVYFPVIYDPSRQDLKELLGMIQSALGEKKAGILSRTGLGNEGLIFSVDSLGSAGWIDVELLKSKVSQNSLFAFRPAPLIRVFTGNFLRYRRRADPDLWIVQVMPGLRAVPLLEPVEREAGAQALFLSQQ